MRKVLSIGLVVFIVVVAGGFGVSWFLQSAELKRNVEETIARVNAKQQFITYQSIETSGFPTDVIVSIVNPRFTGRIDTLMKEIEQAARQSGGVMTDEEKKQLDKFSKLPEWSEDVALNGNVTLGVNAMSSAYVLAVHGTWQSKGKIGAQTIAFERNAGEDTVCRMEMARGSLFTTLWDFGGFTRDPAQFLNDFRLFDCVIPAGTIADSTTKDVLMQWGDSRIYLASTPDGGQKQIRFHMKSTDSEVTPKGDAILDAYIGIVRTMDPFFYYPKMSTFGKQNIEIDFSYTGPADMKKDFIGANIDMHIDKFVLSNSLSNSSGNFVFTKNADASGNQAGKVGFRFEANVGQQYDTYLRDYARFMIEQAYANKDESPQTAMWKETMDKYTPEQMYSIIYPAIPNFSSLGKLVQAMDVSYQLDRSMTAGDITLSSLDFSATPYGVTGAGTVKHTQGQMIPTSNTRLACRNCLQMVGDIFSYIDRIKTVITYFKPEEAAAMPMIPALAQGVKDFLDKLAEKNPTDVTTFNYTIASDPTAGININGRNINDVLAMYNEYVTQAMKPPAKMN